MRSASAEGEGGDRRSGSASSQERMRRPIRGDVRRMLMHPVRIVEVEPMMVHRNRAQQQKLTEVLVVVRGCPQRIEVRVFGLSVEEVAQKTNVNQPRRVGSKRDRN